VYLVQIISRIQVFNQTLQHFPSMLEHTVLSLLGQDSLSAVSSASIIVLKVAEYKGRKKLVL